MLTSSFFSCLGTFLLKLLFASSFEKRRKDLNQFITLICIHFSFFIGLLEDMMHGAKLLKIRCEILFQHGHMSVAKLPGDFETDI